MDYTIPIEALIVVQIAYIDNEFPHFPQFYTFYRKACGNPAIVWEMTLHTKSVFNLFSWL